MSDDLVPIAGGTFRMGSDDFYRDERPVHERTVEDFLVGRHEVTNVEFARFVAATGYTTVAERPLDPGEFPGVDADGLVPGSMVFTPTDGPVDLTDFRQWWRWQPGASWRHPFGPRSSIDDRPHHPVVHVAFDDAVAYASWRGARLPTEAEHEYAARGGLDGAAYAWGDDPYPDGRVLANVWIGRFPYDNRGVGDAAPVGSFPPNGYGLFDMIGNVWEWTSDLYAPRHAVPDGHPVDAGPRVNLLSEPGASTGQAPTRRVLKGGSQLCTPEYCLRFRPAARSAQAEDTGMSHIGFRIARDA